MYSVLALILGKGRRKSLKFNREGDINTVQAGNLLPNTLLQNFLTSAYIRLAYSCVEVLLQVLLLVRQACKNLLETYL